MKRTILILLVSQLINIPVMAQGSEFSDMLDTAERQALMETLQYALENNANGLESAWVNPETGHSGAVVPINGYANEEGLPCRDFNSTIRIGSDEEQRYGTACRQQDGIWAIAYDQEATTYTARPSSRFVYLYGDPYRYRYPWVYYAPFHYPHRLFFSFVFSGGYGGYFHRPYFHDGGRYVGAHRPPLRRKPHPGIHGPASVSRPHPSHRRDGWGLRPSPPRSQGDSKKRPGIPGETIRRAPAEGHSASQPGSFSGRTITHPRTGHSGKILPSPDNRPRIPEGTSRGWEASPKHQPRSGETQKIGPRPHLPQAQPVGKNPAFHPKQGFPGSMRGANGSRAPGSSRPFPATRGGRPGHARP